MTFSEYVISKKIMTFSENGFPFWHTMIPRAYEVGYNVSYENLNFDSVNESILTSGMNFHAPMADLKPNS